MSAGCSGRFGRTSAGPRRDGNLSRGEAKAFRREAAAIGALESRYAADGLSDPELMELQNRFEALRSMIYASGSGGTPKNK